MISLFNQDTSYFFVTGPTGTEAISEAVISLTIDEELGKMPTGQITFHDDAQGFSKILNFGTVVDIEWGYKDPLKSIQNLIADIRNPVEIKGPAFRKGFKAVLLSPSGSMKDNGTGTFSIRFRGAYGAASGKKTRNLIGTAGTIVTQIFTENQILAPFIIFSKFGESFTTKPLRQENETDFQFLKRLAVRFGCVFSVGNTPAGTLTGQFCDPELLDISPYKTLTTAGVGIDNFFAWKSDHTNVINADWEHNLNEDGTGDSLQFVVVAGQPIGTSTSRPRETVLIRKLDMDKLKADMEKAKARGGIEAATKLYTSIVSAPDFGDPAISRYWSAAEAKTAPTGGGWKVDIEAMGSPLYTAGNFVSLGAGFPEVLRNIKGLKMQKVSHNLDEKGYICKIECGNQSAIQR